MPRWVSVEERVPDLDDDVLVWGDQSQPIDFCSPTLARLCSCHEMWIAMGEATALEEDQEATLARRVGTVTHWLDPHPLPGESEPTERGEE
jgi:hypothetical protein